MSVTPDWLYSTLFFTLCIHVLGWSAEAGDVKKVSVFSCRLPVSQLDSRTMKIYVSTLKLETL